MGKFSRGLVAQDTEQSSYNVEAGSPAISRCTGSSHSKEFRLMESTWVPDFYGFPHCESSLNRPAARPACFMCSNSPQISQWRKQRVAEGHLRGLSQDLKSFHWQGRWQGQPFQTTTLSQQKRKYAFQMRNLPDIHWKEKQKQKICGGGEREGKHVWKIISQKRKKKKKSQEWKILGTNSDSPVSLGEFWNEFHLLCRVKRTSEKALKWRQVPVHALFCSSPGLGELRAALCHQCPVWPSVRNLNHLCHKLSWYNRW